MMSVFHTLMSAETRRREASSRARPRYRFASWVRTMEVEMGSEIGLVGAVGGWVKVRYRCWAKWA